MQAPGLEPASVWYEARIKPFGYAVRANLANFIFQTRQLDQNSISREQRSVKAASKSSAREQKKFGHKIGLSKPTYKDTQKKNFSCFQLAKT